jgi:hypothetical protein
MNAKEKMKKLRVVPAKIDVLRRLDSFAKNSECQLGLNTHCRAKVIALKESFCKFIIGMIDGFDAIQQNLSWQPDWSNMWKPEPCDCSPGKFICPKLKTFVIAPYPGTLPYYDPKLYREHAARDNDRNRLRCVFSIYRNPDIFRIDSQNSPCLNHTVKIRLSRYGPE